VAQGFKVADAYIEVHTDDDTKRGRQKIERDTTGWAKALGLRVGNIFARGLTTSIAKVVTTTLSGLFQITKWMTIAAAVGAAVQGVAALVVALGKLVGLAPLVIPAVLSMVSAFAALKIAFNGVGAALQAGWQGDVEKLTEAMKKLAPEAQKFVKALIALKPQLQAFKQAIQGAFFKDLSKDIQVLAAIYLPLLQRHLSNVASIFNEFVSSFVRWLTTKEVIRDWTSTFAGLETILHGVMAALLNVLDGFRHVGVVATGVLAQMTGGLVSATLRFAQFMQQARESGDLEDFIREALTVGRQLIQLLVNVFLILSPIFRVLSQTGGGVLELMVDLTRRLAELLQTAQASEAIKAVFEALNAILVALGPGIVALLGGLGKALLALSPGLTALATFISEGLVQLAPILEQAGGFLAQILQALGPVLPILANFIGNVVMVLGPALVELAPIIVDLFGALASALLPVASILADFIIAIGPSIVTLVGALADSLAALIPIAGPLGQALGEVLTALAPVLPVLGEALAVILTLLTPIVKELAAILGPVLAAWAKIFTHIFERVLPLLAVWVDKTGPIMVQLFDLLTQALTPLIPVLMQVADIFVDELIQFLPDFIEIAQQMVPILTQIVLLFAQGLLQSLQAILPFLPGLVTMVLQLVLTFLKLYVAMAPMIPIFMQLGLMVNRLMLESGFLQVVFGLLEVGIGAIIAVLWVLTKIMGFVSDIAGALSRTIITVGNIITSVFHTVWDWLSNLSGNLGNVLGSVMSTMKNVGRDVITGLWNGISSMGGWLWQHVRDFAMDNIKGALKHALGIGSPSKVAAELARWVPIGMAKGMDDERPKVVDAATRLAMAALPVLQVPPPSLPPGAGGSPASGAGGGGDIYVLADFGDGVRQLVKATITDESELVAASTDEGRRERGFTFSPRART